MWLFLGAFVSSHRATRARILVRRLSDHLQEHADFGAQGTMAGMNHVEAAPQGFGVEEFNGGEFTRAEFASDGELGQEREASPRSTMRLAVSMESTSRAMLGIRPAVRNRLWVRVQSLDPRS